MDGNHPANNLEEQEAWTTRFSGEGWEDRKERSPGATLYIQATVLETAREDIGFCQTSKIGSVKASLKGINGSDAEVGE